MVDPLNALQKKSLEIMTFRLRDMLIDYDRLEYLIDNAFDKGIPYTYPDFTCSIQESKEKINETLVNIQHLLRRQKEYES